MSLDITKVAAQVGAMIAGLRDRRAEREKRRETALRALTDPAIDLAALQKKIAASRTSWLVAGLTEGLAQRYPAPPPPADFAVLASDGSHIEVDRHRAARCYLINIGTVSLSYGSRPDARLTSTPRLYADDADLVIAPPEGGRDQVVEGAVLGIKRAVEECRALAELAAELPAGSRALALLDGTLILWGLEAYPDFVTEALLTNGLLPCLDAMQKIDGDRRLALASYISFPRATDVVNVLRVALCPRDVVDSDITCKDCRSKECEAVAGVRDRDLFGTWLENGQRSARFVNTSKITARYGAHGVHFFYLRVDEEIARVEVPQWVAEDSELLDLTHSLVLDQCRRGHGYPVALSEAHEQAVVTGADRNTFWEMVEAEMVAEKMPGTGSAKSMSKRTRWI